MTKKLSNRIFHPHWKWEENKHNMWGKVKDRNAFLKKAVNFTGDYEKYGRFMRRVAREWKYSCEHNLTGNWQNRQAWIGHAACALALGCPEDITRNAWSYLAEDQQRLANLQADKAIKIWEEKWLKED